MLVEAMLTFARTMLSVPWLGTKHLLLVVALLALGAAVVGYFLVSSTRRPPRVTRQAIAVADQWVAPLRELRFLGGR